MKKGPLTFAEKIAKAKAIEKKKQLIDLQLNALQQSNTIQNLVLQMMAIEPLFYLSLIDDPALLAFFDQADKSRADMIAITKKMETILGQSAVFQEDIKTQQPILERDIFLIAFKEMKPTNGASMAVYFKQNPILLNFLKEKILILTRIYQEFITHQSATCSKSTSSKML